MIAIEGTKPTQATTAVRNRRRISGGMEVFNHHLYEYNKGLRNLVLHTCRIETGRPIIRKLERHGIPYLIYPLGTKRINVFFGSPACLEIVRRIGKFHLHRYTPEEDFILGIMLGYDRSRQCERYLRLKDGHSNGIRSGDKQEQQSIRSRVSVG